MFILPEICTENVLAHLDIVSGVPFLVIPMPLIVGKLDAKPVPSKRPCICDDRQYDDQQLRNSS